MFKTSAYILSRLKPYKEHIIIFSVAFILRFSFFIFAALKSESSFIMNDSDSYLVLAISLMEGRGFTSCQNGITFVAEIFRTPFYPIALAMVGFLGLDIVKATILLQVILDAITSILVYKTLKRLQVSNKMSFLGGLIYACSVLHIVLSQKILTECIFTFLLLLSIYLILDKKINIRKGLLLGTVLGAMMLLRPISVYLPLILAFFYVFYDRIFLKNIFAYLALSYIFLGIWVGRNYYHTGQIVFSSVSSYNKLYTFANYNRALNLNIDEVTSRSQISILLDTMKIPNYSNCNNDFRFLEIYEAKSNEFLSENKARYALSHMIKSLNSFLPPVNYFLEYFKLTQGNRNTLSVLNQKGILSATKYYFKGNYKLLLFTLPIVLFYCTLYLLSFIGLFTFLKDKDYISVLLFSIICYFVLTPGPASEPRFVAPVFSFIIYFGVKGYSLAIYKFYKIIDSGRTHS